MQGGARAGRNHRGWAGAFNETTAKQDPFATLGFPPGIRGRAFLSFGTHAMPSAYTVHATAGGGAWAQLATPDLSRLCLNFERRRERTASNVQ